MTAALDLALRLRSWLRKDERVAFAAVEAGRQRELAAGRAASEMPRREMQALSARGSSPICLGTADTGDGARFPVLLPEKEVRSGGHRLVTGATGSGKSFWAIAVILQMLARRQSGLIVIDMKGETAQLLRTTVLPSLVASLPAEASSTLLRRIVVMAPFDSRATPPFQLLCRDRTLPIELQAGEVASSFGHTVGRDLGVLQATVLKYALQLAIDVGLAFPDLPHLLQNESLLAGAVERCTLPDVRAYFTMRFRRERSASVASLLSRLDHLLMHPSLKRMLSTPGMVRFDRLLEGAVTVVDMTGAPAGMDDVSRFFGQLLFRKLVRAIFARRVQPDSSAITIIADEFQAMLSPDIAGDFERVLTLARSMRCFLWCLFQQAAQVESVSPVLLRILKTNTNYQLMFRSSLEDARGLAHILPVQGNIRRERVGFPDPRNPPAVLTEDEERRRLVERVPSMPDRMAWFWNRRRPYPALLLRSPTVRLGDLERAAARLPREIRDLVASGVLAVGERELEASIGHREARRSQLAQSPTETQPRPRRETVDSRPVLTAGPAPVAEERAPTGATAAADVTAQGEPEPAVQLTAPSGRRSRRGRSGAINLG